MKKCMIFVQLLITIVIVFSIQNGNAQIRINEMDVRTSKSAELEDIVRDQQAEIRTLQIQLLDLQNQLQTLNNEIEVLAVAMQSEKVNFASNISMVFTEIQEVKSHMLSELQDSENRILNELQDRVSPFEQVFEISGSDLVIKSGMIDMQAPIVKFDNIIQGVTIIVQSVISSSYTPGAGNIW